MMHLPAGRLSALFATAVLSAIAASACESSGERDSDSDESADGGAPDYTSGIDAGVLTQPFEACRGVDPSAPNTPLEQYGLAFGMDVVRTNLGLDYFGIQAEQIWPLDSDASAAPRSYGGTGVVCGGASDPSACQAALAALRVPEPQSQYFKHRDFGPGGWLQYLVYTRGDEVGGVYDRADLLALLGPVDEPAKAALVATQQGYTPQCDKPWVRVDGDGFVALTLLELGSCPYRYADVLIRVAADGGLTELQRSERPPGTGCAGRRPAGFVLQGRREVSVGAYFSHVAQLEAASIDAFQILHDELMAYGAPRALVDAATRAARDEVRHARSMSKLATRFGAAEPPRPHVTRGPVRTLEAIALENAREGCVREAFGALEAAWQARFSTDLDVKRTLSMVARDETQHAELAWRVAAWLDAQLDVPTRARVANARHSALRELRAELERRPTPASVTGLPSRSEALELLRQLEPLTTRLAA